MSMKIRRIIEDLQDMDIDIQILALTTIPRLSVDSVLLLDEYRELVAKVEEARQSENSDIVFLARKALNVLNTLGEEAEAVRSASAGTDAPVDDGPVDEAPTDEAPTGDAPVDDAPIDEIPTESGLPSPDPDVAAPPRGPLGDEEDLSVEEAPVIEETATEDEAVLGPSSSTPVEALKGCEDPMEAAKLLARLRGEGSVECLPAVLPFLRHEDARVRANAVEVVATFGDKGHLPELVPLAKDPDNRVRANAIQALGDFGHPQVRFFLTQMLASDEVSMRESAVFAMNQLKGKIDVLESLIRASADPYEGIRLRSIQALASYDLPEAIEALAQRVSDDDDEVREAACAILNDKGADVQKLLARDIEKNQEADPGLEGVTLPEEEMQDEASDLLEAQVAHKEDELFRRVVDRISKGLILQERKAHLSRLLFSVGIEGYELCRVGASKEKAMMVSYYEVVRYQEYLRKLSERLAQTQVGDENVAVLKAGIEQYHGKLRDCFIKMGKQQADLHAKGRGPEAESAQLQALLKFMGKDRP